MNNYKITKLIGEGSLGRVYHAIRSDSKGFYEQPVALKILKNENWVFELKEELETLLKIKSPYCVSVYGWDSLVEGVALVLEWIDGVSLKELSKVFDLDSTEIQYICSEIQSGLVDLSHSGVCHGDLSANNILIDSMGNIKLLDFGISTAKASQRGTPQILSPQRWLGESASIKEDLFSLGLIENYLTHNQLHKEKSMAEWRKNSIALSNPSSQWLHPDSEKRTFVELQKNDCTKERISEKVRFIKNQIKNSHETQLLSEPNEVLALPKYQTRILAFLLITILLAPNLFGQNNKNIFERGYIGYLDVRTHKWVRVYIDNHDLGYAPITQKRLSAGAHKLLWQSSNKQGQKVIHIKNEQTLYFRDSDF